MLAVEVANIQTEVWERRDGRRCESRAWRFVDVDDLATCDCDVATATSTCDCDVLFIIFKWLTISVRSIIILY